MRTRLAERPSMGHHFVAKLTRGGGPPPGDELGSLLRRAERSPDRRAWFGTRKPGSGWTPAPGGLSIALAIDVDPASGAVDLAFGKIADRRDAVDLEPEAQVIYATHPEIATWWLLDSPRRHRLRSLAELPGRSEAGGKSASQSFVGSLSFAYWDFDLFELLGGLLQSVEARRSDEERDYVDSRWYSLPSFLIDDGYGDLRLKGHRISFYHVAHLIVAGIDRDALLEEYPTIESAEMDEIVGFCSAHRDETARYVARYAEDLDRQASEARRGPDLDELRRRFEATRSGVTVS